MARLLVGIFALLPIVTHGQIIRQLAERHCGWFFESPVSVYTEWYWKIDLHNLFHFLSLRADSHAQYEIRAYADVMLRIIEAWVPAATAAFRDYRLGAVTFSAQMMSVLKRMLAGETVTQETSGLNRREWNEFQAAFSDQPPG